MEANSVPSYSRSNRCTLPQYNHVILTDCLFESTNKGQQNDNACGYLIEAKRKIADTLENE
ncbi:MULTISPECIES: hypothetical protein [Staphylococcus]|uniref:Uncharacterized protein n=1 Tax=Staphylococcus schleiferi TaxID=1295 RepID=A0A7Z7QNU4_STASC|nr:MULTISPECIES: hypothetical protein [Staphylococcus]QGS45788.1 hypothetical protein FOB90_03415 [Mammaliicoccus fleurettii]EPD50385.1 hypothetical protein HMPREF1208_01264 [Staphylococcus sp. HGB0015]MBF1992318.1 hypothetical protein [Staphylococcus schleiferi]MBF2038012.1 hypothetical protein [Staphylococcus schleiferi]MBF2099816.1 hypothetical protein [Staphylococcus schleiferi]